MTLPSIPNFNNESGGRLAASRDDFQKHIDGYSLKHEAAGIVLSPPLFIDGSDRSTVRAALQAIIPFAQQPVIPDATTASKGLIQLRGDIAGTATSVTVTRIRNVSVSSLTPTLGQVLTYATDGASNVWKPVAPAAFIAGGDLAGSLSSQQVVAIAGLGSPKTVDVNANVFSFAPTTMPLLTQRPSAIDGYAFSIVTQETTGSTNKSGDLVLETGMYNSSSGIPGGIFLKVGSVSPHAARTMIHATDPGNGNVVSFFKTITTTQMPAATGNNVLYLADTAEPPTTGSPVSGSILYSEDGKVKVKQSNGAAVTIGEISNPAYFGSVGQEQQIIRYFDSIFGPISPTTVNRSVSVDSSSIVHMKITIVAKQLASSNAASYTFIGTFLRLGSVITVGSLITNTPQTNGSASGWTAPTITPLTSTVRIALSSQGSGLTVNYTTLIESLTCGA